MADIGALPQAVHDELDAAARRDPHVRHVLELIAGRRSRPSVGMGQIACRLNAERGAALREQFIADAYTSSEVADLLDVADRRAVAGRRARGTLLGWTIGNETYHPAWQFTATGPVEVGAVVKALAAVTSSPTTPSTRSGSTTGQHRSARARPP